MGLGSVPFHRHYISGKLTSCVHVLREEMLLSSVVSIWSRPFLLPISRDRNRLSCPKGLLLASADTVDRQHLVPGSLLSLQPEKELKSPPTETTLLLTSVLMVLVTKMMLS